MNNSARGADAANATTLSNISGPGPGPQRLAHDFSTSRFIHDPCPVSLFSTVASFARRMSSRFWHSASVSRAWSRLLWWAIGYSLVFAHGCAFFDGTQFAFLRGVTAVPNTDYSYWVSHNVFAMYQLMFAIITRRSSSDRWRSA